MLERQKVDLTRLTRARLATLLTMIVMVAAVMAVPTAANAHSGHSCSGVTSSGFSCTRSNFQTSTRTIRRVSTYYNGSLRTYSVLYFERDTGFFDLAYVCDSRSFDNITARLEVERVTIPGHIDYYYDRGTDVGGCVLHDAASSFMDRYRLTTFSSGSFSHATAWCRSCVP